MLLQRGAAGSVARCAGRVLPASAPRVLLAPCKSANGVATAVSTEERVMQLEQELAKLRAENAQLRETLATLKPEVAAVIPTTSIAPGAVREEELSGMTYDDIKELLGAGIHWPMPHETNFWERAARSGPSPLKLEDSLKLPKTRDNHQLQIVHVAAELAPIGKVGGLGDVVAGLSKACIARGHNVSVIMPFYESLDKSQIEGLKHELDLDVPKGVRWDGEMRIETLRTSVFWGKVAGVPTYFLRPADWNACNIFKGGRIYAGSYDEREAYLYMCRAALEFLKVSGQQPHIVQVHDWHAAALPMLYWEAYHNDGLWRPRMVMTIHNMDNSGECRQDEFYFTGLPGEMFAQIDKALDERTIGHNPERLNLMKGGLIYSNKITTVSPTYANDLMNGGAGSFLKPIFNQEHVSIKFSGILNGVDIADWNPADDPLLPANYSADTPAGKALCKEYLQKGLGLNIDPSKPLVAVVSRLVGQKNPGLMQAAAYRCRDLGAQFVLLGSGGQDGALRAAANGDFKDHPDVRILIMYSEKLSHLIYAAADIVLVPSNFEPCGLTQMIAMRYGALPLVRRTGGLADTVRDVDTWQGPEAERNGYSFDGADAGSLNGALDRAVKLFRDDPAKWNKIALRNMQADVSWGKSAKEYVDLYMSVADLS